ncbi:MAG: hypothetical protein O2995_04380, partial [Proteobacteria bacterium]|nr:hypothetical protein [Pseudomonadota bacterium]
QIALPSNRPGSLIETGPLIRGRPRPFNGDINYPNVTKASGDAGLTVTTVDPSTAGNRTVTLMTDVVSSRPWTLLGPLVAPVGDV